MQTSDSQQSHASSVANGHRTTTGVSKQHGDTVGEQSGRNSSSTSAAGGDQTGGNSPVHSLFAGQQQHGTADLFVDFDGMNGSGGGGAGGGMTSHHPLGSDIASFSWLSEPMPTSLSRSLNMDMDLSDMLPLGDDGAMDMDGMASVVSGSSACCGSSDITNGGDFTADMFEDPRTISLDRRGNIHGSSSMPPQIPQASMAHSSSNPLNTRNNNNVKNANSNTHHPVQHCSTALLSTLDDLGLPNPSCKGSTAATRSLGTILKASRCAIDSALKVVSCNCPANPNNALLVTSVMFRVLCWYEAVLQSSGGGGGGDGGNAAFAGGNSVDGSSVGSNTGSEEGGGSSVSSVSFGDDVVDAERMMHLKHASPSFSSKPSSAHLHHRNNNNLDVSHSRSGTPIPSGISTPSSGSVVVPRIAIGAYELDFDDKARIIVQVVLSELAKMNRLLDGFSCKFCKTGLGHEESRGELHGMLEMFLRNKHGVVARVAGKQLM